MKTNLAVALLTSALLSACATAPPTLDRTLWKLEQIDGLAPQAGADGVPTLSLETASGRASGYSGCNRFVSKIEHQGAALRFEPPAGTRMACPEGMEIENRFLAALGRTNRYRLAGDWLELYAGETLLMRFSAAPTP